MYFWGGYTTQLHGCIPKEGGCDTGDGRSISIQPNSGVLIENSWPALPAGKIKQKVI